MLPFFPSLRPPIANHLWFDADESCDDDADVTAMENEHQDWVNKISQIASDLNPIGKKLNEQIENIESEDEDGANDESDDSDNSDEDDDLEEIANGGRNIGDRITLDATYDREDEPANETI